MPETSLPELDSIRQAAVEHSLASCLAAGHEPVMRYARELMSRDMVELAQASRAASEMECHIDALELTIADLRAQIQSLRQTSDTAWRVALTVRPGALPRELRETLHQVAEEVLPREPVMPCAVCGTPKPINEWCPQCAGDETNGHSADGDAEEVLTSSPEADTGACRAEADPSPEDPAQPSDATPPREMQAPTAQRQRPVLDVHPITPEELKAMLVERGLNGSQAARLAGVNSGLVYAFLSSGKGNQATLQRVVDAVLDRPTLVAAPTLDAHHWVKEQPSAPCEAALPIVTLPTEPPTSEQMDADEASETASDLDQAAQQQADRELAEAQAAHQELLDAKDLVRSTLNASEATDRESIIAGLVGCGVRPALAERAYRGVLRDEQLRLEQQEMEQIALEKIRSNGGGQQARRGPGRPRTNGVAVAG